MQLLSRRLDADKIGGVASFLCAVHCFFTSVALGFLSVIGLGFFGSIWTDIAFFGVAILIGSFAIVSGYRRHHSKLPALIFASALVMVVLGHFVFGHDHSSHEGEALHLLTSILSVGGGLTLVTFHFVNARLIRQRKLA